MACGVAPKQPITYKVDKNITFYSGDELIGFIPPAMPNDEVRSFDSLEQVEEGVFRWVRTFLYATPKPPDTNNLIMKFCNSGTDGFHMIPAVTYDDSVCSDSEWKEGVGLFHKGEPLWFAYHRTAIPGATYSENPKWSVALFGDTQEQFTPFSCSLAPKFISGKTITTHYLIWPEMEKPWSYTSRDNFTEGYQSPRIPYEGNHIQRTAWLVFYPTQPGHRSISRFLDYAWKRNYHKTQPAFSPKKLWELGVRYAKESLWAEEDLYKGFSIGLTWDGKQWIQRKRWKYEIGWCGQNASLANSLLYDYLIHGDKNSLNKALICLDTWAEHAPLPNGLLRCHFDYILEEEGLHPEVQDACNLGTGARNYFEAYELALACGHDKPQYLEVALNICDFAVNCQEKNGRLGKSWNNKGECVDPKGTVGAFLIPPLLAAYQKTNDDKYLLAAKKAFDFYYSQFEKTGFTTAGALDTYCIDKESAMPLLRSALMLYSSTKNRDYVDAAEHVSYYLATWQWHYTSPFPKDSMLGEMNYDSFGGTSVSTQHQHMDFYALYWVNHWLELAEITGKEIWRQRALAIWANGTFAISDGTLNTGEALRPAGSQGEAVFHTRWGWGGEKAMGTFNNWLVAWPTAFRLETLRNLENWSILDQ